jgi:glycosyltransferase involved in cell wall biosynthesis
MRLEEADLVVLSHLRWDWVWQRPQHLISRLAEGRRTLFVEEPLVADVAEPTVRVRAAGALTRMWLEVPPADDGVPPEYGGLPAVSYSAGIQALLAERPRDVWLYTPTAQTIADSLQPRLLAYDVMDDLSSFADATPEMKLLTHRSLARADIVFAGGRSLHRAASAARGELPTHLFPSGVEQEHYRRSRSLRGPHARPVAGYVGVVDERLDLALIAELARRLPDWDIQIVGPTTKIDPRAVPSAPNLIRLGQQPYERLPEIMAGFDVALMPFALNEATRSISPTKTLEYLAAGLPVVSTRVPDVVSEWGALVRFADDGEGFAAGCRAVLLDSAAAREEKLAAVAARFEWDRIAASMRSLMVSLVDARDAAAA